MDVLYLVVDCQTSHCVWHTLKQARASPFNSCIMQLHVFSALIAMHMQQPKSLFEELAAAGLPISLEYFNLYMFRGEFKDLVIASRPS